VILNLSFFTSPFKVISVDVASLSIAIAIVSLSLVVYVPLIPEV